MLPSDSISLASSQFRNALIIIAGFSLFTAILQLTIPLYMLQIYDRVLPSQSSDTLIFLSIIAAFALIVLGLTEMVRQFVGNRAAVKLDTTLSSDVLEKVIRHGRQSNSNTQPIRDLQAVRALVGSKILTGVVDLPFSLVFIGCLFLIHPTLFWLTVIGTAVLIFIAVLNLTLTREYNLSQINNAVQANRQTEYFARNADSLIAMGMVKDVIARWGILNAQSLIASDKSSKINSVCAGTSRIFRFGIQVVMLGVGAWLVQLGEMTAGMIFAASIISGRALQPIDVVVNSWPQLSAGLHSWRKVKEYLSNDAGTKTYSAIPKPVGHLAVTGVFQPNVVNSKLPPILSRVSFQLEAGESVAVIGPSGSGKSTLARIIVGATRPYSGKVCIDGNNIQNWDPADLGKHIGYLSQDVEMLPGTVAQNIARFRPDAADEEILDAARIAHVEDMIKNMPLGMDTPIGPGGLEISGGEKQRIALARAFFGTPKVLVLDEPNSSLDRMGEYAFLSALKEAKAQRITVFLVTQRESVVGHVDNIMRIQNGHLLDFGPRKEILHKYSSQREQITGSEQKVPSPAMMGA